MKLKLFIVACMFIILASADILDVEYGDNDDEESVENNGKEIKNKKFK